MYRLAAFLLQCLALASAGVYPNYHADFVDGDVEIEMRQQQMKWWQAGTFYQIYPRSFKDSNGDGVGDLNGITASLPYLKELGITATWLSPIFTSPMADFGYDIANFTEIAPIFGTMADFEQLMRAANEQNIKIILDFVPNHSSDECEWFKRSAAGEEKYKDYYVWHPGHLVNGTRQPPSNWISVFRGSAWQWHEGRKEYYLHQFVKKQPDLNYRNPKVREAMQNVLRFWLAKGVAGFRIDAVPHVFELAPNSEGQYKDEPRNDWVHDPDDYGYLQHIYTVDQPETIALVYEWRAVLDEYQRQHGGDERILLAETYSPIDIVMKYYGNGTAEGAQLPFNFLLISELTNASNAEAYAQTVRKWLDHMPEGRTANWVLGNHDKPRVASRLGTDRVDMLNMLTATLPGASVTYQGEELGMTDVWISWNDTVDPSACNTNPNIYEQYTRDPERTPFQWSADEDAGFSNASKTWLPIAKDYREVNVVEQRKDPQSHLNIYKQLIQLRHNASTLQLGATEVKALSGAVLAVKRSLLHDYTYFTVLNINDGTETVNLQESFENLLPQLEVVLATSQSKSKAGDIVDVTALSLLPKEALILRTTGKLATASGYYTYYTSGNSRHMPVIGIYTLLTEVAVLLSYLSYLAV
ncbi:maltase A3 [Scaptodrosophila lebanonensis]|uniref:alpha-glucosidase n=1 Tax=Drosophila lebanonensis TaxID=7225 RepID=A0A6J2UG59_DROLE|nr:maltase A3 [Scaptodrosophila lebanonensis]